MTIKLYSKEAILCSIYPVSLLFCLLWIPMKN